MEGVLKDLYDASEKAQTPVTDAVFMFNMGGLAWKHMGTTTGKDILISSIDSFLCLSWDINLSSFF